MSQPVRRSAAAAEDAPTPPPKEDRGAAASTDPDVWTEVGADVWARRPFDWLLGTREPPRRVTVSRRPPPPVVRAPTAPRHVILVSGPKDGTGRTTFATHLAVGLLQSGVATGVLDLNLARPDLNAWLRRRCARADAADLVAPAFLALGGGDPAPRTVGGAFAPTEADALARWPAALATLATACDALVVDAPSGFGVLAAALAARADTIVSLVTDHDTEADGLLADGPTPGERARPGPYGQMMWNELRKRVAAGRSGPTWLLVRNRALDGPPAYAARVDHAFDVAARMMGARRGPVLREDAAWRCGASGGLTALDPPFAAAADAGVAAAVSRVIDAAGLKSLDALTSVG